MKPTVRKVAKFEEEQMEILKVIEGNMRLGGRAWNKYNGDVCCRIVKEYVEKYVSKDCKVVGPHVYAKGIPTKFDLSIVDKNAMPERYVNAYPVESIRCIIEVKKRGLYGR